MIGSRRPGASTRVRVRELDSGRVLDREDRLATEEPLELRLSWPGFPAERLTVTMRTPGADFDLAAGFLYGEGVIGSPADLHTVAYCTDQTLTVEQKFNVVTVSLSRPPRRPLSARYEGPGAGSAACGVCGKQTIEDVLCLGSAPSLADRWAGLRLDRAVLLSLPQRLREAQRVFDSTGGVHAAGLFSADGTPVAVREDVGRHNAVDKVIGAQVLSETTTQLPVLCVSGRIGFELVQKAVVAGVGVLAAVGAPSSLAVALAEEADLCLVGFVRGQRCVVYTVPGRISG